MSAEIVQLDEHRLPEHFTITVARFPDGKLAFQVCGVPDDAASCLYWAQALRNMAGTLEARGRAFMAAVERKNGEG